MPLFQRSGVRPVQRARANFSTRAPGIDYFISGRAATCVGASLRFREAHTRAGLGGQLLSWTGRRPDGVTAMVELGRTASCPTVTYDTAAAGVADSSSNAGNRAGSSSFNSHSLQKPTYADGPCAPQVRRREKGSGRRGAVVGRVGRCASKMRTPPNVGGLVGGCRTDRGRSARAPRSKLGATLRSRRRARAESACAGVAGMTDRGA